MARLSLILVFSSLGGTFLLHYLKNFLLKEHRKIQVDFDGILERFLITYIILALPDYWITIPLIILLKALFRLYLIGLISGIIQVNEPGGAPQKVLLKTELAFDLFASPVFAILLGVIFK